MPLSYPEEVVTCDIIIQTPQRFTSSRLYFRPAAAITTQAIFQTMANTVDGVIADSVLAPQLLGINSLLHPCFFRYKTTGLDWEATAVRAAIPGEVEDGELMPDEVVYEVQRRTGLAGRNNRGRIFLSGVPEYNNDNGRLTDAAKASLKAFAAVLTPTLATTPGLQHIHWDRKTSHFWPVTQVRAMAIFASRRDRRKPLNLSPVP